MVKIKTLIFDILFILYQEILYSYLVFNTFPTNMSFIFLFSIVAGLIYNIITKNIFKEKGNKILSYIFMFGICFIFGAQLVYYKIYESIISFYSIMGGGQVLQFIDMIFKVILENILGIILIFFPMFIFIILHFTKQISFRRDEIRAIFLKLILVILIHIITITLIKASDDDEMYSAKNLYFNTHSATLSVNNFGILTTMKLDLMRLLFGFEEKAIEQYEEKILEDVEDNNVNAEEIIEEKEIEYNITEIDFNTLIENEKNKNIIKLHEYFANEEPTNKNEYTGMFKGKNLVVFVAEAFSTLAIREDLTPNLYKLYREGFQFNNFYTPIFPVSTADGEYIADTSLLPKEGVWSLSKINGNYIPYSYANIFKKLGYSARAYHNHTAAYYDRDKYIKTMGYDSYLATGTGLEKRMNTKRWPNSDYEMLNVTIDDYINDEKFLAYYMTVSGHLNYTFTGNAMSSRNFDLVKDLPYSAKARGYLAAQIELDKAIEELLKRLEEAGKLEDTVIIISGDHYPYGLTLNEINELSTYERDDIFEKYHMPFLVWSGSMKEPIKIDKLGSSLDILPTVLNLFGVEYDSRLLIGKDILSDVSPIVIFSNRSFITDRGKYNAITKKFSDETVDSEYINRINSIIYTRYQISRMVLENNYYKYLNLGE